MNPGESSNSSTLTGESNTPVELPALPAGFFCPECGYDLRGLTSERCPECGEDISFIRSQVTEIPWVRRREIGRFRAYWRTVWLAMFRYKRLAREMVRTVSYADAQAFRWVTILHAFVPFPAALLLTRLLLPETAAGGGGIYGITRVVIPLVCWLLTLIALTGVPSYLFHPRYLPIEQQNRAIALSYYASAAWSWLWLALVPYTLFLATVPDNEKLAVFFILLTCSMPLAIQFAVLFDVAHLARDVTHRASAGVAAAIRAALFSAIIVAGVLGFVPLAIGYIALVVISLA